MLEDWVAAGVQGERNAAAPEQSLHQLEIAAGILLPSERGVDQDAPQGGPAPSYSCNAATPTNLLPSVITSVVHDHAAPVAHYLGAIDTR